MFWPTDFETWSFNCIVGDLLENYCHDDDLMTVGRFLFAVTIMLTYPIECFVTREVSEQRHQYSIIHTGVNAGFISLCL